MQMQPLKFRILIVDDEESGRTALHILLKKNFGAYIDSIQFAKSFEEAKEHLSLDTYHLIFLDINLRGISAFDLLTAIPTLSKVVFVTAYSEFILKALRNKAFDYLIKPIKEEELKECLGRLIIENDNDKATIHIKQHGITRVIKLKDIIFIEGDGPYSKFNLANEVVVTARTLKAIHQDLGDTFIRIHKTYMVNKLYIKGFNRETLILNNQKCLPVSRTGFKELST